MTKQESKLTLDISSDTGWETFLNKEICYDISKSGLFISARQM